jgi:hypothetical protein
MIHIYRTTSGVASPIKEYVVLEKIVNAKAVDKVNHFSIKKEICFNIELLKGFCVITFVDNFNSCDLHHS